MREALLFRALDPVLLRALDPVLLRALDPVLLRALDPALLRALDPVLLRALDPALLRALDPALFRALDPALFGAAFFAAPPWPAPAAAFRLRVAAAFFAAALRAEAGRAFEAAPPLRPPFFAGSLFTGLPTPEPDFFPPPVILLTVAQARRSASPSDKPRFSYPSSMCSACRFCLSV
ncbi:hypothetical protein [Sorangium sp. So ce542]|uniref:hypothetical protein n=1 Tax=Sorangium sp. So ce542 TaxID=3133316 RepID=UPI003F63733E